VLIVRTQTRVVDFTEISVQGSIVSCKVEEQLLEGSFLYQFCIVYLWTKKILKYWLLTTCIFLQFICQSNNVLLLPASKSQLNIELHAPTSSTQKLKLMGRGGQFTYIPTLPLTWRLPQASDVFYLIVLTKIQTRDLWL